MVGKTNVGTVFFDLRTNRGAFTKEIHSAGSSAQSIMSSSMGKVGKLVATAFSVTAVVAFGKKCVQVASETQSAWQGLSSILNGQGKSFTEANSFIQSYIKDGLVPLNNAVSAYKNLAARGYSTDQIEKVMTALKDSAAFGRQASYSYGDAITTATEGLKNENSILVDNAGVTKNVAKMWEEYAKSIGTTRDKLTDQQKIQAEVNGIIKETRWQTGDAAKYADSFAGRIAKLSASYTTLKTSIGEAVMPIVNMFLPAVQLAIDGATRLSNAVKSMLTAFGIDVPDISAYTNTASTASQAVQAITDEGKATEAAAKKAKKARGAFAAFDEINVLNKNSSSNGSSSDGSSADKSRGESAVGANSSAFKLSESYEETFGSVFDPMVNAWNTKGADVIRSAKEALNNIKSLLSSVKTSFGQVWSNGTGQTMLELLLGITEDIFDTVGGIASAFNGAWTNAGKGTGIIQNISNSVNNLLGIAKGVSGAVSHWWNSEAGKSFADTTVELFRKISGNVERVTTKFKELWDAGGRTAFENIQNALGNIGEIFEIVIGYVSDFYADLVDWFAPDAEIAMASVNDSLSNFNSFLEWLKTDGKPILEGVAYTIGTVTAAWIAYKVITAAVSVATKAFSAAQAVANAVMTANPAMLVVAGIAALIAVIILCVKHWDKIKAAASSAWDTIKDKWNGAKEWFNTHVTEPIKNLFSGVWKSIKGTFASVAGFFKDKFSAAWTAVKNVFSSVGSFFGKVWDKIKEKFTSIGTKIGEAVSGAFKKAVNSVFATIERILNTPINAINKLLDVINKVPGISIPKLNTFDLPRLAQGGWLAANNPRLIVAGDNRREGEIVAPESKIREQVELALSKFKGNAAATAQTLKLLIEVLVRYPDGRTVIKQINETQIKEGRILLEL